MTKQTEALKLALEALKQIDEAMPFPVAKLAQKVIREALAEQPAQQQKEGFASPGGGYVPAIPRPMPLDWKLVPRKATPEMLKAMDECAQEGYDERLYAGMASSVYMAAWDASPVMGTLPEQPAQQQEPVAYASDVEFDDETEIIPAEQKGKLGTAGLRIPLYIQPPASKPWVGLTEQEIEKLAVESGKATFLNDDEQTDILWFDGDCVCLARAIEAKLREKNA